MEKRSAERVSSSLPVEVFVGSKKWSGTCINLSLEGALLKLESLWEGDQDLDLQIDPAVRTGVAPTRARVVRATSPDQKGSFLAVRFLPPVR